MNKPEIIAQLKKNYEAFALYIESLSAEELAYRYQDKWSALEQLIHLDICVKPLVKGVAIPREALAQAFGITDRENRSYEELVKTYQGKLAAGGKATGRFSPDPNRTYEGKEGLLKSLREQIGKLADLVDGYEEKELESLIVPHPLIGATTLKEMLYHAIYHARHHQNLAETYLSHRQEN